MILRIAVVGTRPPRDPAFMSDFVARVELAFEGSLSHGSWSSADRILVSDAWRLNRGSGAGGELP